MSGSQRKDEPPAAEIEAGATVKAKKLRFERVPETEVRFPGSDEERSGSHTERENLPDEVEPGVTYRDVKVRWESGAAFRAEVAPEVAEAMAEEDEERTAKDKERVMAGQGGGNNDEADGDAKGRAAPGHGSGRRMPVQQAIDVAVPVSVAYDHWTRFEDWPDFMHRVENAEQVDDATVSFQVKIWGISKRFEADILEQHPDERIEWNVTEGYAHTGVVTFHPLSENLTGRGDARRPAVESDRQGEPGMRFVKRAVRGDMHRFKAYVELDHDEKDGWRGTIEEGRVKKARRSGSSSRSRGSSRRTSRNGSKAESRSKAKAGT